MDGIYSLNIALAVSDLFIFSGGWCHFFIQTLLSLLVPEPGLVCRLYFAQPSLWYWGMEGGSGRLSEGLSSHDPPSNRLLCVSLALSMMSNNSLFKLHILNFWLWSHQSCEPSPSHFCFSHTGQFTVTQFSSSNNLLMSQMQSPCNRGKQ